MKAKEYAKKQREQIVTYEDEKMKKGRKPYLNHEAIIGEVYLASSA